MAQTGSCFVSPPVRAATPLTHAAPFPLPPGLADTNGGSETASGKELQASNGSMSDHPDDRLSQLRHNSDRQAIIDAVRQAVLRDVDTKVSDKVKDLWSRGRSLLNNIEQENQKKATEISEMLSQCQEKQEALAAENERLRTTLANVVHQFQVLGSVFGNAEGGAAAVGAAAPSPAAAAPSTPAGLDVSAVSGSSPQEAASAELFAPGVFPAATAGTAGSAPLPEVPAWPFPVAPPATPATPLSLSEALGSEPTQQVPLSLMGSLPAPTPTMEQPMASGIFSFTLRKADGTDLGLNVSHHEDDKVLRVEGVRAEGAVEAWNRQCQGSAACEKAVFPGDRIISVNSIIYEPLRMLEECRDKQLLKLTIVRGEHPLPGISSVSAQASPAKITTLSADAKEFVPTGASGLTPASNQGVADSGISADVIKADCVTNGDKAPAVA